MRPPSAPPPLNPAPVVRAPRGRKDIGMMPAPDVFTPMELTFANVSGMEVEVDITVSGALQSPTEMDIDVDFEPSLPCASNVTDRERSDPHPRWGSSLKNSSLSSLPERSKSFSHASRSSTPTQILSTHSVLSHTPHHSRLGIPYSGRAQTPPSSMYLSPLASPYEIPSPPSHSRSHTLAQSPSMPFIKKLSGSSSSSVHFSPNLRASASVRPSPLVRSMSLSALEQDIGEGMGMIRQEMGLGLGLIVEGEGERTPNLSSESEKGYFDLIMTNRGSTYAEAEQ
ncbi:uncharacterized protein EI90DRAFT_3071472 [Cantharellus anzutake]|uniref:uncharacterized protein n=1 Tax=Cantharellus anzutake TaxID=1750568 RepID=UPI001905EF87|nr:uncharacterized protein EI90DRAFT_3071472 [Cantharellus anzutake]KAF8326092.1 hypothetical protein EI90DRAFT_3071472 [Cantharellus anzutake]